MSAKLGEIVRTYSTTPAAFGNALQTLSQEEVVKLFTELLGKYINDRNSSSLREFITVTVAGFIHKEEKIGFDGVKKLPEGKEAFCEAKPQNVRTEDFAAFKSKARKTRPKSLDGHGNFNDYTRARFAKDTEENASLLFSGFIDGKLLYVLEVPFNTPGIAAAIVKQLDKRFSVSEGPGQYLRSARVSFKDYYSSEELMVKYVASHAALEEYKRYMIRPLYEFLSSHA